MENVWRDLKFAFRGMRQQPGFTAAAILALALGIGVNTVIFSLVNAVLLNSLPLRTLRESERLVMIWEKNPSLPGFIASRVPVCLKNYLDWKQQARSFEGLALYGMDSFRLTSIGGGRLKPEQVSGATATADFFPLLGIRPRLGRNFRAEEMQPGRARVVILGDALFRSRFAGDPRAVGTTLLANGVEHEIVGVLPPRFELPAMGEGFDQNYPKLWAPVRIGAGGHSESHRHFFVFGRLKRGATLAQARAEMTVIAGRLAQSDPKLNTGFGANVFPLAEEDVSPALRRGLLVLQAAVAFVLLIACANVANLLLARAVGREREIAIRTALGAGRLRIVRQSLTESLLLSALGGGAGLLLALWGLRVAGAAAPSNTHGFQELRLDLPVLGFTLAAAMLAGLLFGLAPALHAFRRSVGESLGRGPRSGGGSSNRLRSALVVAEVALSLMLLAGAGLMTRSLMTLLSPERQGFRPDHVLTMRLALPEAKYTKPQTLIFGDRLLEAVRALPGVQAATLADGVPMRQISMGPYRLEGVPERPNDQPTACLSSVREGYFETLGIRLLRGRGFTRQDIAATRWPAPVVVNESFARQNWPNQDPLGKIVLLPDGKGGNTRRVVIGVTASVRQFGPDSDSQAEIYLPEAEYRTPSLLVRTSGPPLALLPAVEKQVWAIDKDQPVHDADSMENVLRDWISQRRFTMLALAVFATAALTLAGVGLYGVLAYSVSLRRREIGVRAALGADPRGVAWLVVRQGLALTAAGVVLGLAGALAFTRLLASLVFGVSATDPVTFAAAALVLFAVAALAGYFPARRAAGVDPAEVLRAE